MDHTRNNIEQLHENQEELASAYHVGERMDMISRVPSAITTVGKSPITAETVSKMVSDGMALMIKELRRELATGTNRSKATPEDKKGPHDKIWTKWKYWCYTCGTNVSHDSREHTGQHKDSAHDKHLDDTKDDTQGGNSTKDKYWMKWCDHTTYQAKDKPE